MTKLDRREVAIRAARTASLTGAAVAVLEPDVRSMLLSSAPAIRAGIPVLAVGAAMLLWVLGRRIAARGRWPHRTVRYLLAVGWMLAGAPVLRRLVTVEPNLAALMVSALVLPARAAMRW